MAGIKAKFQIIDEMSSALERIAQNGQRISTQFETIGTSMNTIFDGISGEIQSTASSCDGVADSIANIQAAEENVISSSDDFADSLDDVDKTLEMIDSAMRRCEQSSTRLSDAVEFAGKNQKSLSDAMEKAAKISEELANNEAVSAEAKDKLTNASQEAERAMNALAEAEQRANAAMDEYNRILGSGTEDLEQLSTAADKANRAALELEAANRVAAEATEELSGAVKEATDEAKKSSDAADELSKALTAAGITALVVGIADSFMEASKAASIFEVGMKKISTIADTSKASLSQISSDITALSMETGVFTDSLEEAVYSALSASVDTANAVQFTATATKLAGGGFTSSATAVDVLTTALNAYQLEAGQAERISDMLITTQNLGKTTVDELAVSVGKVIPLASAYGVEMDNLSAAYAELTKGGIATAEAGTYLKSMLNELGDSGSMVSAVLLEQTGYSFSQLMDQGYSLGDVMAVLGESVNGNAGAFNELWSSSEAGIGALALYNAGAEQFNTTLAAMQNSIGATDAAYETMTDTTAHAQEELSNAANNLKISIGQNLNPLVEKLYGLGTDILNGISRFVQEHPVLIKIIAATAIGLTTVTAGVVAFNVASKAATTTVIPAIKAFALALNTSLGPIGWVVSGVTALVVAGVALYHMFEDAEDETEGMTAATREQYYELKNLNSEYENACEKYGETSDEALRLQYQIDDLSAAFEANRQTVEGFTAEVDALCESSSKLTEDFHSEITAIKNSELGALSLIQKYEDLATQTDLAAGQEKALEAITKKLSETYPDLAAQMDGATLSTEEYVEAMKKACEQQAEEQRQAQAQETYIEALEKRAELTEEIAKAQENVNLEQKRMDDMSGWKHFWSHGEWDDLEAYQEALEKLNAAQEENEATIARIEQGWSTIANAEAIAAQEGISWEEAASTAYESVQRDIEDLCTAYEDVYKAALESFRGQFGLFDEASIKSEAYLSATVENAQKALESQITYWQDYNANLQTIIEYGQDLTGEARENYRELLIYTQDGSEQAAGFASSMARAIRSGDEDAVNSLSNTLAELSKQQAVATTMTANFSTDFSVQMDEIEQEMKSTVENMNLSEEAAQAAQETVTAYADQIRAGRETIAEATERTVSWQDAVSDAYENIRSNVSELCVAYDEAYGAAARSFEGQFGLFDEASVKSEKYTKSTVENAQKALESQLAYWENYNTNLQVLTEYGKGLTGEARENYEALLAYAQDGSEQAAGFADSMAAAIQKGDMDAIESLSNTMAKVSEQQEAAAAVTADFLTDFSAQMDEIELEMQSTVENMNLSEEAAVSAKSTIEAYADQIRNGKNGAVNAATEVADAVAAALASRGAGVSVSVNTKAASIPAHANGTTNAENVFLAGEEGPELIARPAATYAKGTTNSTDYFIAGENGPELIAGEPGSTVFPTQETDRLISALNEKRRPLQILAGTGTNDRVEGGGATEQVKRILLEIAGSGAIEIDSKADKETILAVLYEHLKPVLMNIVQSEIYEEGQYSYGY
jgi:TP901 family phage tail tape measure protein